MWLSNTAKYVLRNIVIITKRNCALFEILIPKQKKMAANGIKRTTSLVGYAVVPNARDVLCSLYAKTISVIQSFPKDSAYRRQTEQVVQQRLQIVQADSSAESIESKIGCGQLEELIDQAERELSLAVKMEDWKPWEPLVAEPPPNQWKWP